MYVDERRAGLIDDLAAGKIGEEEFLRRFPVEPGARSALARQILETAASKKDADAVELGMIVGFHFGFGEGDVDILNTLLREDWHRKHEDIVFALGRLRSPSSVDPVCEAAQKNLPYLDYDDGYALRSKAVHALANIGTPPAVRCLERLAGSFDDPDLLGKIGRALAQVEGESADPEAREEARRALARGVGKPPSGGAAPSKGEAS